MVGLYRDSPVDNAITAPFRIVKLDKPPILSGLNSLNDYGPYFVIDMVMFSTGNKEVDNGYKWYFLTIVLPFLS